MVLLLGSLEIVRGSVVEVVLDVVELVLDIGLLGGVDDNLDVSHLDYITNLTLLKIFSIFDVRLPNNIPHLSLKRPL